MKQFVLITCVLVLCGMVRGVPAWASDSRRDMVRENLHKLIATNECRSCDLAGVDLNRMDLAGADLQSADLTGAKLYLVNLSKANLQNANLRGAGLGGSDLSNADLRGADLTGVILAGAYLAGALMDDEPITKNVDNGGLVQVEPAYPVEEESLPGSRLVTHEVVVRERQDFESPPATVPVSEPVVGEQQEERAELDQAVVSGVAPTAAPALSQKMDHHALMRRAKSLPVIADAILPGGSAVQHGAEDTVATSVAQVAPAVAADIMALSGGVPGGVKERQAAGMNETKVLPQEKQKTMARLLAEKRCMECDLSGADLSGVDLQEADLERADLRGVNLVDVDLRRANLKGANLRGADLRKADLRKADLYSADLREADLTGADLEDALLDSANFYGATGLEESLFDD